MRAHLRTKIFFQARNRNATVPADANPDYIPGKTRLGDSNECPLDRPYVGGSTLSCGCGKAFKSRTCDAKRCCFEEYQVSQ